MTIPGTHEQDAEKLECYNCGMKGHMFFACPEDTRRVPAGLEASRKRQASSNDYHGPAKRSKGPVITHYPPPLPPPPPGVPPIPPPPAPRPGYDGHYLGPPPGLPTVPPLPPPPTLGYHEPYSAPDRGREISRRFPYPSARDAYEHHSQSAPPGVALEAYRPPRYDDHPPYGSGYSPGTPHGRPHSAASGRYDDRPPGLPPGPPFGVSPRPGLQYHYDRYPTAPPAIDIDRYPPRPPPPYPPPPSSDGYHDLVHYGYDGSRAPPARPYPSHQGFPPGGYPHPSHQYPPFDFPPAHTPHDDRLGPWPPYDQRRDSHDHFEHHSEHRHNRDRRHNRRSRYDSPKGRGRSERRFQDRPSKASSGQNSPPPPQTSQNPAASLHEISEQHRSNGATSNAGATGESKVGESKVDDRKTGDLSWEEEVIFKEIPVKITKDLIREPLPLDWTDEPMMPPKYGIETIISKYVTVESIEEFAMDVRRTKAWEVVQHHPAFVKPTDMNMAKLREYEAALDGGSPHKKHNHQNINSRQRDKSFGQRSRTHRQNRQPHQHGQSHEQRSNLSRPTRLRETDKDRGRGSREHVAAREIENGPIRNRSKTSSPEPGEVSESEGGQGLPPPRNKSASPPWGEDRRQARPNRNGRVVKNSRGSEVDRPDVSGPPTPASPSSRSPSRHGSPGSPGSPLTPTELELLGMAPDSSDSETRHDSPPPPPSPPPHPPPNETSTKARKRPARAKLHSAYQRRW